MADVQLNLKTESSGGGTPRTESQGTPRGSQPASPDGYQKMAATPRGSAPKSPANLPRIAVPVTFAKDTKSNMPAIRRAYLMHRRVFTAYAVVPVTCVFLMLFCFGALVLVNSNLESHLDDFKTSFASEELSSLHYGCADFLDQLLFPMVATQDSLFGYSSDVYKKMKIEYVDWAAMLGIFVLTGGVACYDYYGRLNELAPMQTDTTFQDMKQAFLQYRNQVGELAYLCDQGGMVATDKNLTLSPIQCQTQALPAYLSDDFQTLTSRYRNLSHQLYENWVDKHADNADSVDSLSQVLMAISIITIALPVVFGIATLVLRFLSQHYETELSNHAQHSRAKLAQLLKESIKNDESTLSHSSDPQARTTSMSSAQTGSSLSSTSNAASSQSQEPSADQAHARAQRMTPFRVRKLVADVCVSVGMVVMFGCAIALLVVYVSQQHQPMLDITKNNRYERIVGPLAWKEWTVEANWRSAFIQAAYGDPLGGVQTARRRVAENIKSLDEIMPTLPVLWYQASSPTCGKLAGGEGWKIHKKYVEEVMQTCFPGNLDDETVQNVCPPETIQAILVNHPSVPVHFAKLTEDARANSTDCMEDVGDYIHAKQLEAQDNTDDSLTLIITLLWVCIPIAIVVAIGTIFSVRYVWQLLSTYCSVIEWSLRMVVKDHDAKAILLQSMKARCAEESLMCYDEMTKLSHAIKRGSPNVKEHAEVLKKTFIETGAPKEVNISTEERKALIAAIDALGNGPAEAREKAVSFGSPSSPASPSSLGTSPASATTPDAVVVTVKPEQGEAKPQETKDTKESGEKEAKTEVKKPASQSGPSSPTHADSKADKADALRMLPAGSKQLAAHIKEVRRTLFRLIETNDFRKLLLYPAFIKYAQSKNDELMDTVAVISKV